MTVALGLVATKVAACRFLIALANVFNFCWFIVGNVFVFGHWSDYSKGHTNCDELTYMLIIAWVAAPIICILFAVSARSP